MHNNCYIAGNACPIFEVWFLGDKSLEKWFDTFTEIEEESRENREVVLPYLFEFYDVKKFTSAEWAKKRKEEAGEGDTAYETNDDPMLARIVNSLLDALSEAPRLPRFIIVALDKDLVEEAAVWNPDAAVIKTFNEITSWLARQLSIYTKRKRLEVAEQTSGAIFGDDPKIIFVKMLRRYDFYSANCLIGKICSVRTKFNESINIAADKYDQKVMNVSICSRPDHFDLCGEVSRKGMVAFWRELDHLVERFDKNEIKLRPTPARPSTTQQARMASINARY